MQRYTQVVQNSTGDILTNVTVTVKLAGTGTLATLFSDNLATPTAKANPFVNDTDGSFEFYAANGRYDLVLTLPGFTFDPTSTTDISLFDGQAVLATGSTSLVSVSDRFAREYWVEDFGTMTANGGGSANNSTVIQTAINYVGGTALGGRLRIKPLRYDSSTGLTNTYNNVFLMGSGEGANRGGADDSGSAATVLKWTGSAGGTMYDLGPAVSAANNVTGGGILGIFWNGNKVAGTGVNIRSVRNNVFRMTIAETTTVGLDIGVENTVTTDPPDTQQNWFESLVVIQQDVTSGIGIRLKGGTVANASLNHFGILRLLHYNGVALDVGQSDGNLFDQTMIFRAAAGTGIGVLLRAGTTPAYARNNTFAFLQSSAGGVTSQGTPSGSTPAQFNVILSYSLGNAAPLPVVETGSSFSYNTDKGTLHIARSDSSAAAVLELQRTTNTTATNLSKIEFHGDNASNVDKEYGNIAAQIVTNTAGAEDGDVRIATQVTGVLTNQLIAANGVKLGTATGGSLGTGSLNAVVLYVGGSSVGGVETLTYAAAMTPDQRVGQNHFVAVTDNVAFVFSVPSNGKDGDTTTIMMRNTSGGALTGADPFVTNYKMGAAWTYPANGQRRSITFMRLSGAWCETGRTAADVAG